MATITKIEVQKKDANKVSIFLDGEFYCGLYLDTAIKYSLKEDVEIDIKKLDEIVLESEKYLAFNKAINYLGEALKTEKQIRDYLYKKNYNKNTISYVVEKLKEYNYLNDEKYAENYIKTYRSKYGINMLRNKLYEKGISKNITENALSEFQSEDSEIYTLLVKKIGNKEVTNDLLTKCIRFLSGRGFSYDEIKNAINAFKNNRNLNFENIDDI